MALRRHRGAHNLFGTGQCRRLAKLVPNMAADNGTAALLNHAFIEWLAARVAAGQRPRVRPVQNELGQAAKGRVTSTLVGWGDPLTRWALDNAPALSS